MSILSQIIAYAPNKIDTETKARSLVQEPRNMYAGGRIPFAKAKSVQKVGNQKGKFTAKSMDNISDAILKAYADDNIQILFEKSKSNLQGLLTRKDSKAGIFQKIKTKL